MNQHFYPQYNVAWTFFGFKMPKNIILGVMGVRRGSGNVKMRRTEIISRNTTLFRSFVQDCITIVAAFDFCEKFLIFRKKDCCMVDDFIANCLRPI